MRWYAFIALMIVTLLSACSTQQQESPYMAAFLEGDVVKEITIIAKDFTFEPSTIEVMKGDNVRLRLVSKDVRHGILITGYGINEAFSPGEDAIVEFTADREGEFGFRCSVYCGKGHSTMKGTLIVR